MDVIDNVASGMDVRLSTSSASSMCGLNEQNADILTSLSDDDQSRDEHHDLSLVNGTSSNNTTMKADNVFSDEATNHVDTPHDMKKTGKHVNGVSPKKPLKRQKSVDSVQGVTNEAKSHSSLKSGTKTRTRSSSTWNLCTGSNPKPSITPRENKASIQRKLKQSGSVSMDEDNAYMTPFQRKELAIRDLRRELEESHEKLQEKDEEIQHFVSERNMELSLVLAGKDAEIHTLREQSRLLQEECVKLIDEQDKLKDERDDLKLRNKEMELDAKMSEERSNEMYLTMYEKGKRSAEFERQDTLEDLATEDPESVPTSELLAKLQQTQEQLAQLQSTTRQNQYDDAILLSPTTDSEAAYRCVRDALFHFLCSPDKQSKKLHLNILLGLAGFTEVQKDNIEKAMSKSKSHKKSSK